jgi:hypothetical protein
MYDLVIEQRPTPSGHCVLWLYVVGVPFLMQLGVLLLFRWMRQPPKTVYANAELV